MAAKVVGLISSVYPQVKDKGIEERIKELEDKYGKLDPTIVFVIGEEVARQKFCEFNSLVEAIEAGTRVGLAYQTLAVVSSPIEGFTGLNTKKRKDDGKEYLEAHFSGPIRSAGTTASCLVLMLIDYLREVFGFAKYDPTEDEINRVYAELQHFHDRVTNLQYMPTEEEAKFLARNMTIQVSGESSEKVEVPNYKGLERVDTDILRSGFCLVMAEGLAQKAPKGFRLLNTAKKNGVPSTSFDWLQEYIELHEKTVKGTGDKAGPSTPAYIKDIVAGRPIYGHPARSGAFRFRYGRSRTSGFSAASIHPASMAVTEDFIATGTQLKQEKPSKGCALTSCDTIEGPIVKFYNGNVKKIKTDEEARQAYKDIDEIIYLGDFLFPFSDIINRNADLPKSGYVEEWWELELKEQGHEEKVKSQELSFDEAVSYSKKYSDLPLHPLYIHYWKEISQEQFKNLIEWLRKSWIDEKLILPFNKQEAEDYSRGKRALELLGIEHQISTENVVVEKEYAKSLFANIGLDYGLLDKGEKVFVKDSLNRNYDFEKESVLETVDEASKFIIKDKSGEFIGSRMGRPEKAKLRKLQGSPNVLFPVGEDGGKMRSLREAIKQGQVKSAFPLTYCDNCQKESIYPVCEVCNSKTRQMYYHPETKENSFEEQKGESQGVPYSTRSIDIKHYFDSALNRLGMREEDLPKMIKGVKGTSSDKHIMENLEKGLLRSKYGLQVNKDGTIRMDATELPLVYFKPKEVSVSVEKLRELGYEHDIYGKPLENEEQMIELMPHDVLLPACPESLDEKGDEVFTKVANFVDDELSKYYGVKPYYNIKNKEDLVGHLGVCMAPHNCGGVICRFIGFSKVQALVASPYMHAAIRRDCDGDEAAVMLLGDVLLNFSNEFLPSHRGGTQDAPLVVNSKIDAGEVDDQILDFELSWGYPLDLYKKAEEGKHSEEVEGIEIVKDAMKAGKDPFKNLGFTHDTSDLNGGTKCCAYKLLGTMQEKVEHQMTLAEKLRGADVSDTARLIIERHFLRDMRGNLRGFSTQDFRCVGCNGIIRRPPLSGKCPVCGGKLIFTVHEGGIKKYLDPALDLSNKYHLSTYLKQNLELLKRNLESIFGKEPEKQEGLNQWF